MSSSKVQRKSSKRTRVSQRQSDINEEEDDMEVYEPIEEIELIEEVTDSPKGLGKDLVVAENEKATKQSKHDAVLNKAYIESKKGKKERSKFWDSYRRYMDENDKIRAECVHCKKTFAADPKINGTRNLSFHVEKCIENPANKTKGTQSKLILQQNDETRECNVKSWVLNQDESRKSLAKMIILDELPFRHVDKIGFKGFVATTCPTFKIPSRHTVAQDCYELFLNEKISLKGWMSKNCQRVCLTTDTWTSNQRINYMVVTCHFIDNDWNLQRRILNFCPIVNHKGDSLARGLEDCLSAWGLDQKLFTVTVDNASANDVMCACLKDMSIENGSSINDGRSLHMRCVAHIGNLIVNDGLKLHHTCIEKVRFMVRHLRFSPARLKTFREQVDKLKISCQLKLILDVCTRWNSTYMMLDIALKYKNVFSRLEIPEPKGSEGEFLGHMPGDDWVQVEMLVKFLKVFYDFTKNVSGSSYVTVSNVFYIGNVIAVLNEWINNTDYQCQSMAFQMKAKCDKYWGSLQNINMMVFVAIVLNPNHKLTMVEMALQAIHGKDKGEKMTQEVKAFTMMLFEEYKVKYCPSNLDNRASQSRVCSTPMGIEGNSFLMGLTQRLEEQDVSGSRFATNEFEAYLIEQRTTDIDILGWWRLNGCKYPILAHIARDVFAIPITTVPSESAFSTGGRTLDDYRSSLTPKTVQGLICAQDWLLAKIRVRYDNDVEQEEEVDEVFGKLHKDVEELLALGSLSIADKEPIFC